MRWGTNVPHISAKVLVNHVISKVTYFSSWFRPVLPTLHAQLAGLRLIPSDLGTAISAYIRDLTGHRLKLESRNTTAESLHCNFSVYERVEPVAGGLSYKE